MALDGNGRVEPSLGGSSLELRVTDPMNNVTTSAYADTGRLTSTTDPD